MSKGIFITGTGTDIGKTYVTALILKKMTDNGINAGYYKAALSGADTIEVSDAGYVHKIANLKQDKDTLVSYLYKNAMSPHLAAQLEGNPVELAKVKSDFNKVQGNHDYIAVEGSGGVICPIRYDTTTTIFLKDIVKLLGLSTIIIADAGLGTINSVVLSVEWLKSHGIAIGGIIFNNYIGDVIEDDNLKMIELMTGVEIIAKVAPNDADLNIDICKIIELFKEIVE